MWLLACTSDRAVLEETIWFATVEATAARSELHLPSASWPTTQALRVNCEDSDPKSPPACRLNNMYKCARNDMKGAYMGAKNFGYVPRWAWTDETGGTSSRCAGTAADANAPNVRELVLARMSASEVTLHARVEVGGRTAECVTHWGSARVPDRLVNPGLDLALACATRQLLELEPARERFEDLVSSLWTSTRLAGMEYEYKYGEIFDLHELYPILKDELELHHWWTVEEQSR